MLKRVRLPGRESSPFVMGRIEGCRRSADGVGRPTFLIRAGAVTILPVMGKEKADTFQVACPDCGAMIVVDAATGLVVSHTSAPRKRMFEDLETAAKAMREQDERKESIFRQSVDAEKNKQHLFDKKLAEALRKAKDAPAGKPIREFDLD